MSASILENVCEGDGGAKADHLMEAIHRQRQRGNLPPAAPIMTIQATIDLTNTSRVSLMMLLVEHVNQVPKPYTLQAREPIILLPIKQAKQQLLRHDSNLAKLHCCLINVPEDYRWASWAVAESCENQLVLARDEEGGEHPRRPERLDFAPRMLVEIEC